MEFPFLNNMTFEEKLRLMEALWDSLLRSGRQIPSPPWHKESVAERETDVAMGIDEAEDWEVAKRRILDEISKERMDF
jgi:hypothetical protein